MHRGVVARILWPMSMLFRLAVAARRFAYVHGWLKAVCLPVPVIVVGNIFIGGTGKTPFTIWLVEKLREAGYRPGVISRGYGGKGAGLRHAQPESDPFYVGDEPVLIAQRTGCPVVVGADRVAAGQSLLATYPETDVIVADDGLQHYRLARTIEIVLGDARGLGNGWLLPAGPLREPPDRHRDFEVCNIGTAPVRAAGKRNAAGGGVATTMRLEVAAAHWLHDPTYTYTLTDIAAIVPIPVIVAVAGMGNPIRFFDSLRGAGLVFEHMPLPDHHVFTASTFSNCHADIILMTEKDAVKCRKIEALANDARLWFVPVSADIDPSLADNILEKLRGSATT